MKKTTSCVICLLAAFAGCASGTLGDRPVVVFGTPGTDGTSKTITIHFEISDADLSICDVAVQYRADGGAWTAATLVSTTAGVARGGRVEGIAAATAPRTCDVVWDSWADRVGEAGPATVSIRLTPSDIDGAGEAVEFDMPAAVDNHLAELVVDAATIEFGTRLARVAEQAADERSLTITDGNGATGTTLYWTVTSNQAWVLVSAASGTTPAAAPYSSVVTLVADVDDAGLLARPEPYVAELTIVGLDGDAGGDDAHASPQTVSVSVTVRDPEAEIFLHDGGGSTEVTSLPEFVMVQGGADPAAQSFWVANVGEDGSVLAWSATDNLVSPDWLVGFETSPSGTLASGSSVEVPVAVDGTGVAAGHYAGRITVAGTETTSGAAARGGDRTVDVSLWVQLPPEISASPMAMVFEAEEGEANPPAQTLSITNPGDAPLNWAVSDDAAWLLLAPVDPSPCTTETDHVTVSVDTTGLTPQTYTATITVTAPGATNTPVTIPVTLHLIDNLTDGLVGWWRLDETAGTTAADSSPNAYHGTLVNGPTWLPAGGMMGGAASFDGTNDYIDVPNSPNVSGGSFSVTAWIYKSSGTERKFVSKWNDNSSEFQFDCQVYSDSKTWFQVRQSNNIARVARGTTLIQNGAWYHYVGVADASTNTMRIYLDGEEETLQSAPGWDGTIRSVAMELNIGRKATGTHYWHGTIDDVRIYDRALSAADVMNLYNNGVGPYAPTIESAPTTVALVGTAYTYTVATRGNPLPAVSVSGLPSWLSFDGLDTISGTPGAGDTGTTGPITVTAANGVAPDATQQFTIDVGTLDPGLLAWWTFDEMTGTTAADSSGNGNTVTLHGPTWAAGHIGGAIDFSASSDYAISALPISATTYTMCFWLYRTANTGVNPRILEPTSSDWVVWNRENSTGIGFYFKYGSLYAPTPPALNTWEHYAVVFDTSAGSGSIYRDGVPVDTGTVTEAAPTAVWVIGHNRSLGNNQDTWPGRIDDIRVYNRALTPAEIQALASM